MPVAGISPRDAAEFIEWLRVSGRVPTARFCSETEWERGARGADDRIYPHGNQLKGEDANIDSTYGRSAASFGPDEVGAHPTSDSPFGLHDMAGNVIEIVRSELGGGTFIGKGGGYYHDALSARLTNRIAIDDAVRFHTIGLRVCADVSAATGGP